MTDPIESLNFTLALVAGIGVLALGLTSDLAGRQAREDDALDSLDENWECCDLDLRDPDPRDVDFRDVDLRDLDWFGDLDSEDREHGR
jgi:hypothetical protein